MICWRAKLSYQFAQALPKGLMVILLKVGFFPGTSCSTFESNWWIVMIPRRPLKIAPMRTNKFSNAGFDLQGEYEEQQLQLGFLAYLPQIMVGRRIAPDGSLMDPHPHSIRQHLEE